MIQKNLHTRYDFEFDIVTVPFLDVDVPRRPSYGVGLYLYLNLFALPEDLRMFNNHNKLNYQTP